MNFKKPPGGNMKGSILGGLLIMVLCFLLLFPVLLMFSSLWLNTRITIDNQITNSTMNSTLQNEALNHINGLGNSFFLNSSDQIIILMYMALIVAFFISALYESSNPASLPLALLFLIPLILITFPLADIAHAFYTNAGFANVAGYYKGTEYLINYSPMITIVITLVYIVLLATKKGVPGSGGGGGGTSIVTG